MPSSHSMTKRLLENLLTKKTLQEYENNLRSVFPLEKALPPRIPGGTDWSLAAQKNRIKLLQNIQKISLSQLSGEGPAEDPLAFQGNIENFVGMTLIPTGVMGPLRVNGLEAKGDFYIPMATTEGALVASYQRGALLSSLSGGIRALCSVEQVQRAPCFLFENAIEAGKFIAWVTEHFEDVKKVASQQSRHAVLEEVRVYLNGNWVYLILGYNTGDASGQNMVTLCTDAVCRAMASGSPIPPKQWFVEGNLSGDKKATAASFLLVRGKLVTAEVCIPKNLVRRVLHTTPENMVRYWTVSIVGGIQSGSIGVQGHYANGLAAIYLACGQDVACVAEAAVGVTRMSVTEKGDLYVSITLPNLIVGTVGGGTRLATQRECLALMECLGDGKARKFAEICAAAVLAGEISIIGSLAAGDFAAAHAAFGRPKKARS